MDKPIPNSKKLDEVKGIVTQMIPYLEDLEMAQANSHESCFEPGKGGGGKFIWDRKEFPITHRQLLIIQTVRAILDTRLAHSAIWTQDEVVSMALAELFVREGKEGLWVASLKSLLHKLMRQRW